MDIQGINSSIKLYNKIKDMLWEFEDFDFRLYNVESLKSLEKHDTNEDFINFKNNLDAENPTITVILLLYDSSSTGGS